MEIMNYLKEPIIRKHIFGIFQTFIGMGIGFYFMFTTDNNLTILLLGFMMMSFLFGHLNIRSASEVMAISAALAHIILKQKEDRTEWEEKHIEDFENTSLYRTLNENGIEI